MYQVSFASKRTKGCVEWAERRGRERERERERERKRESERVRERSKRKKERERMCVGGYVEGE